MGNDPIHAGDPGGRPLIALAEDEGTIRILITRILIAQGFRVKAFGLGHEALDWIANHSGKLDLLITDVNMPGMSGKELADEVCKRMPDAKILFISGYSPYPMEDLNGCANPDGVFLLKPFRPDELLARVREILALGPRTREDP